MLISIIYLVISLFLEVIMSNFFSSTLSDVSLFTTIYTIIGLVIIYPHFSNLKKYFLLTIFFGSLFGILYGCGFVFGLIIFLLIGLMIRFLYNVFPENVFMTNLISYMYFIVDYRSTLQLRRITNPPQPYLSNIQTSEKTEISEDLLLH